MAPNKNGTRGALCFTYRRFVRLVCSKPLGGEGTSKKAEKRLRREKEEAIMKMFQLSHRHLARLDRAGNLVAAEIVSKFDGFSTAALHMRCQVDTPIT